MCATFLFVVYLNGHHQEWLGSMIRNRQGVADFVVATAFGCDKLVVGPTHARGGTFDLLMTDVPDLVRFAVVSPLGNSDYLCVAKRQAATHSSKTSPPRHM